MTAPNATAEPPPSDSTLLENVRYLRGVFHEVIDIASMLLRVTANDFAVERVSARNAGETVDRAPYIADLERITLVIRRTAMLDMKLEEPVKRAPAQERAPRAAADTIEGERPAPRERSERDRADRERADRPDRPERPADEDISHLPVDEAVAALRNDLGVAGARPEPAAPRPGTAPEFATGAPHRHMNGGASPAQGPPPPNIRP